MSGEVEEIRRFFYTADKKTIGTCWKKADQLFKKIKAPQEIREAEGYLEGLAMLRSSFTSRPKKVRKNPASG